MSAQHPIAFWSGCLALMKLVVMPCFCLISGHLSPAELDMRRARGVCQLLVTYLIFQGLYFVQRILAFRLAGFDLDALPVQLFNPHEQVVTWFLLALVVWRIAVPLLRQARAPLLTSVAIGLAALFIDLGVNYQNILAFLPYFIGGALLPGSRWDDLSRPAVRCPLAAFFCVAALGVLGFSCFGGHAFAVAFEQITLTYSCFDGAPPAASAGACSSLRELCMRLAFYGLSVPLLFGFLATMPTRPGILTAPGYMSIYVYLLHPLLLFNPPLMKITFDVCPSPPPATRHLPCTAPAVRLLAACHTRQGRLH